MCLQGLIKYKTTLFRKCLGTEQTKRDYLNQCWPILLPHICVTRLRLNTWRPRQNTGRFADDRFKCIFLNENIWISLKFSLEFVLRVPINNTPALVQIMAWRQPGDKPLFEPMMVSILTHICVIRPEWFKWLGGLKYHKTSNVRRTLIGNKSVDHSDVVGASPDSAAPTISSFSTSHLASRDSAKTAVRQYDNFLSVETWWVWY